VRVECKHPVGAAVEKQQAFVPIETKSARIENPVVFAESPKEFAVGVEVEKRAVSVTIGAGRARDEKRHEARGCPNASSLAV
jgi:hypothetical protein